MCAFPQTLSFPTMHRAALTHSRLSPPPFSLLSLSLPSLSPSLPLFHLPSLSFSSGNGGYHLSTTNDKCDNGVDVQQAHCLAAAKHIVSEAGYTMGREQLQGPGTWDFVAGGCSVQSGGDWAAHFSTLTSQAGDGSYTRICTGAGRWIHTHFRDRDRDRIGIRIGIRIGHSLTHSLTHPLTHSLTHSPIWSVY